MRYLRARASARFRRFSLTSMVWLRSHCCHASFETFSQIRLPSSPGYGGNSRPSASRPSLTHFTIRAIDGLYALQEHLRPAPPVVERLALRRQRRHFRRSEALLEEPVRRVRGHGEDLAQLLRLGTLFAGSQQPLAVAGVPVVGRYREAGEFGALRVRKRREPGAAGDRAVVLDDDEVPDLGFEQLAAALHQRAFGFQGLYERQHAADVFDARRPQLLELVGADHGADAGGREKLEQQRPGDAARDQMHASYTGVQRLHGVLDRARGLRREAAFAREALGLVRRELAQHLAAAVDRQ